MDRQSVAVLVRGFDGGDDGEAIKSRELVLGLLTRSAQPFRRDQFTPGHITCTGVALSPDRCRFLLVHHRRLDRWLLPGGHVESEDAQIGDTARREVIEETGAELDPGCEPRLVGIDVHGIPGKGSEPYHLHHDLIFAFETRSDRRVCTAEVRDVVWCGTGEFTRYELPSSIRRSVERALR